MQVKIAVVCLFCLLGMALAAQTNPLMFTILRVDEPDSKITLLDKYWYFIPGEFLDPHTTSLPDKAIPVSIPVALTPLLADSALPYGTLMCFIQMPSIDRFSIKTPQMATAARFFLDGSELFHCGSPAANRAAERPNWTAGLYDFPAPEFPGQVMTILIHVSSFNDNFFGLTRPFELGSTRSLQVRKILLVGQDFFMVGIMLVMAFFYLVAWLAETGQKSFLYFFMLCSSLSLRPLLYGEMAVQLLWPELPFGLLFRAGYLTMSLAIIAAPAFLQSMFPKTVPRLLMYLNLLIGGLYSLIIVFLPLILVSRLLPFVQAFIVLSSLTSLIYLFIAFYRREIGALEMMLGFVFMTVTVFLDILSAKALVSLPSLSPLGLIVLILLLSVAVSRNHARALFLAKRLGKELKIINDQMSSFVPSEFLQQLGVLSLGDIRLGQNVQQEMTVMFVDIRSFTTIAEELGPDSTFTFLNTWLGQMGPVIRKYGGFIDKYLGDGILALFPETDCNAIACALEMLESMNELNADRQESGFQPVRVGIGLHRGAVILGTIGEPRRMDTTVISDTVNIAARLEALTKEFGITIAVSRELLKAADFDRHKIRGLGKITVKGRYQPVDVCEIYDCDSSGLRQKKDEALAKFDEGIACFFSQRFEEAVRVFQFLVDTIPEDQPSHYYARMARKLKI